MAPSTSIDWRVKAPHQVVSPVDVVLRVAIGLVEVKRVYRRGQISEGGGRFDHNQGRGYNLRSPPIADTGCRVSPSRRSISGCWGIFDDAMLPEYNTVSIS